MSCRDVPAGELGLAQWGTGYEGLRMTKQPGLSVVIPALNEGPNLALLLPEVQEALKPTSGV